MRKTSVVALLVLAACFGWSCVPAYAQAPQSHQHRFDDAAQWASRRDFLVQNHDFLPNQYYLVLSLPAR